ncbi:MAG: FAD-binding oxidoreductase [Hyphomicrobiaceae bacterium]
MSSTAHADAFHFSRPVKSYWEATADPLGFDTRPLEGPAKTDVAIVGAGFTGLNAALRLREAYDFDVTVLDAAEPGWGASGRNGGFCGLGGTKLSYPELIRRYGKDDVLRFFDVQKEAIELVKDTCRRFSIDASLCEMGELCVAHKPSRIAELKAEAEFLRTVIGKDMHLLSKAEMKERGCDSPSFHGALWGEIGLSLHPLDYVRGLARAVAGNGARIHGRSRVVRWEERAGRHILTTERGGRLEARDVLVATNGFTDERVPTPVARRVMPALSAILVTRPMSEAERLAQGWTSRQMAYDTRRLLHYFRLLPDGRMMFGGRGGTDASDGALGALEMRLRRNFERLFPAWAHVEHTHFWRGFVCFSRNLLPYVGPLDADRRVWSAIAYHGSGVAMGSWCGRAVADLIAGEGVRASVPRALTSGLDPYPLAGLRPVYLKGAYLWYGIEDEIR